MGKLILHSDAKQEASDYKNTNKRVSYTQALAVIANKNGYETYEAFKVFLDESNKNPLQIKFDIDKLDKKISVMKKHSNCNIINDSNKKDLIVLTSNNNIYGELDISSALLGYFKSEKELSFREKIAQSISMLGLMIEGCNTGRGSSYGHRDYVTSDFDVDMLRGAEGILESINDFPYKSKIRDNDCYGDYSISFVEFDFKKEETVLYMKNLLCDITFLESIFYSKKQDFILPFVFEAFPFYNVSKIIAYSYEDRKWIEVNNKGKKEVIIEDNHFSM